MRKLFVILAGAALLALGLMVSGSLRSDGSKNPVVVLDTSMGTIKVELFQDKSPITVANFLQYVDSKHYDGTLFHRVIPNFMIQTGGMDSNFTEKPTKPPIKNEAGNGIANTRGTLAMARTDDPNSATSQFFISLKDNTHLNKSSSSAGYAVFGKVIDGMDVVDKIGQVPTGRRAGHPDVPKTDVILKTARRADK